MKKMMGKNRGDIGGIKIRTLNYLMIIIAVIIYSLLLWKTIDVQTHYNELTDKTQSYIDCRSDALELRVGSDYLTSQVRLFSVTGNIQYCNNYFHESEVERRRDRALERLKRHTSDELLISRIETALNLSNELMKREIYSMRLVVEGHHYDISQYNKAVRECVLSDEDAALSDSEKLYLAENMLLDSDYLSEKSHIDSKVDNSIEHIINQIHDSQIASSEEFGKTLLLQKILIGLLFAMSAAIFLMVVLLVIKPLGVYMNHIKAGEKLTSTATYEFNYLAHTYNNIFELNEANKNLQYTADHDPLTGLLNRSAFEDFAAFTAERNAPIALIFIDIDNFNVINNTYGHYTSDEILKKLARILVGKFRSEDCISRLRDDEFAVIIMNATEEIKDRICDTVDDINKELHADKEHGLPEISVSAGIAFSENGYDDRLYKHADAALFRAKNEGQKKCRFYEGKIEAPNK